ncbi:MAG TPA: DUF4214 domain-containing protein [Pirellulales bacterium]|nr:DUF4214 domain-containing protein [Pirellulales bacterium]
MHQERLQDGTIGTPQQNWVQEVYRDVFHRQAESSGLDFWVAELAEGTSRGEVAYQMVKVASFEEFQRDAVAALYEQYLGRAPDPAGLTYWPAISTTAARLKGCHKPRQLGRVLAGARGRNGRRLFERPLSRRAGPVDRPGRAGVLRRTDCQGHVGGGGGRNRLYQRRVSPRPRQRVVRAVFGAPG